MMEFIKMFGLGILYTILSPLFLLAFLLFVVFAFINYLVQEVMSLVGFFAGKRFSVETDLDKKLKQMRLEKQEASHVEGGDLHV